MSQLKQNAVVTNGSQTVVMPGINLASQIRANHVFMMADDLVPYWVAADATFDGFDTHFTLTGAFQAYTHTGQGVVVTDATYPSNIPTIAPGDVGTAAIFTAAMYRIQALLGQGGTGTGNIGLPIASANSLGAIKIGSGLVITADGTLSSTGGSGGSAYTLPFASTTVLGGVKIGANLSIDSNGVISAATSTGSNGGTVTNVTGTLPIRISLGSTTPAISIDAASANAAGSMSAADFNKLSNIAPGANNYSLPIATAIALGGIRIGTGLTIDANGVVSVSVVSGTGKVTVSSVAPSSPTNGDQWYNLSDGKYYIFVNDGDSSAWVEPGATAGQGRDAHKTCSWRSAGNSTTVTTEGNVAFTVTGTSTAANVATTTKQTWLRRVEYLVTAAATTAVAGFRLAAAQWARGAVAGEGGFKMVCRWGPATGVATATTRAFVGMAASTAAPADANPSSMVDMVGFGWDAGDANLQFFHNDSAGTAVKLDLGANFPRPTADRTKAYEIGIFALPDDTQISYQILDLATGAVASGAVSADLPTPTTLMAPRGYMSVGGTSAVIGMAFMSMTIETDY